jgi:hypothetical protein
MGTFLGCERRSATDFFRLRPLTFEARLRLPPADESEDDAEEDSSLELSPEEDEDPEEVSSSSKDGSKALSVLSLINAPWMTFMGSRP